MIGGGNCGWKRKKIEHGVNKNGKNKRNNIIIICSCNKCRGSSRNERDKDDDRVKGEVMVMDACEGGNNNNNSNEEASKRNKSTDADH